MAMTACLAKLATSSVCFSVNGLTSWRKIVIAPINSFSLSIGTTKYVRAPAKSASATTEGLPSRYGGRARISSMWTTLRVRLEERVRQRGGVGGWHIVVRNGTVAPLLVKIHLAKICSADARGIFEHFPATRIQFASRRADGLENLRSRGLLLQ